jgi:hypothetical protein
MFFKKKKKKEATACPKCKSEINVQYSYCPYCGLHLVNPEKELKEFGMLGKNDIADAEMIRHAFATNLGIADKLIGTLVNSLFRNLDVQVREIRETQNLEATEIKNTPTGVKIRIGMPVQQRRRPASSRDARTMSDAQLARLAELPRTEAKTNIRRLGDKVVYDLAAQGVASVDDVFVSKTESGYEIKAIAKNKVYVNNVPVNLPLRGFSIHEKGLTVEFSTR